MRMTENNIILINILSTFILQGIAFLTTPLFSRLLGTDQYGVYSLFYSWMQIVTCTMGLNVATCIGTGYYAFKKKYYEFRGSILLLLTILACFELLIIIVFKKNISSIIGLSQEIVLLIGITSLAHSVVNFTQTCFIYEKKAIGNFILSVGIAFSTVLLSIVFIYFSYFNDRSLGRIVGTTIPYCVAAIVGGVLLYVKPSMNNLLEYWRYGLTVGTPIVFHSLSQLVLGQSDRVMMQMYNLNLSEIGIYSLFYTLTGALSTLLSSLNNSWCPFYYDDVSEQKWDVLDKKCKNYIELFTVLGVGFLLLSREVSYLMADESYWDGIDVIPLLAFAVYFTFMYQFPVNFEFFYKKTKTIAIGTVGAGLLNIILNALMIPLWGMYGAAIATALSYLALFFAHYYIVTHMKGLSYHLKMSVFVPGLMGMIAGSIFFYVLSSWWYVRWGVGFALGCVELYRIYKRKTIF